MWYFQELYVYKNNFYKIIQIMEYYQSIFKDKKHIKKFITQLYNQIQESYHL